MAHCFEVFDAVTAADYNRYLFYRVVSHFDVLQGRISECYRHITSRVEDIWKKFWSPKSFDKDENDDKENMDVTKDESDDKDKKDPPSDQERTNSKVQLVN